MIVEELREMADDLEDEVAFIKSYTETFVALVDATDACTVGRNFYPSEAFHAAFLAAKALLADGRIREAISR